MLVNVYREVAVLRPGRNKHEGPFNDLVPNEWQDIATLTSCLAPNSYFSYSSLRTHKSVRRNARVVDLCRFTRLNVWYSSLWSFAVGGLTRLIATVLMPPSV